MGTTGWADRIDRRCWIFPLLCFGLAMVCRAGDRRRSLTRWKHWAVASQIHTEARGTGADWMLAGGGGQRYRIVYLSLIPQALIACDAGAQEGRALFCRGFAGASEAGRSSSGGRGSAAARGVPPGAHRKRRWRCQGRRHPEEVHRPAAAICRVSSVPVSAAGSTRLPGMQQTLSLERSCAEYTGEDSSGRRAHRTRSLVPAPGSGQSPAAAGVCRCHHRYHAAGA